MQLQITLFNTLFKNSKIYKKEISIVVMINNGVHHTHYGNSTLLLLCILKHDPGQPSAVLL